MRTNTIASGLGAASLTLTALALASGPALAAEYWLKAGVTSVADPNGGAAIPMWGYASCTSAFATCGAYSVPGPALTVPATESELKVHLLNALPGSPAPPTSLVVNGLIKKMTPVWDSGATGARPSVTARVRSFDDEAAAGGTADYTWSGVKPGTYLYQSGTQPQVQVQMGLYGAVSKNALDALGSVRAQAYTGTKYEYDSQVTLLYSEIDPDLHAAVASGTYGTATGPTSTFAYAPKLFLINGAPFQYGTTPAIAATGTTLLRMLNAGLTTHVPSVHGKHWDVVAEDGRPYTYAPPQYTAMLPAAKTVDAMLVPDIGGARYPIMDRRLSLSNGGAPNGGMLAFLQYGAVGLAGLPAPGDTNLPPVANADTYNSIAGVELSVGAAQGVLVNDSDPDGLPQPLRAVAASGATTANGSYVLNANGSFIYTPPATIAAATDDTFTYVVTDGKALSPAATVTIKLTAPVAPVLGAPLDNFNRTASTAGLGASWSQSVGTAPASPNLQLNGTQAVTAAIDLGAQAIWIKDNDPSPTVDTSIFGAKQFAGFTATPLLDSALILKATGGTTKDPANFVRVRIEGGNIVIATQVGGNNAPVYVRQAAFPAGAASGTLSAVVDEKGLVTVFLNGAYKGGVQLPDVGAWKGGGRIGIQMQTQGATVDDFSGGSL